MAFQLCGYVGCQLQNAYETKVAKLVILALEVNKNHSLINIIIKQTLLKLMEFRTYIKTDDKMRCISGLKISIMIILRELMAEVSGGRVRGRPRLGWMDGVKVALGNRGMTVEAARQ